jgi:hypothetical protein
MEINSESTISSEDSNFVYISLNIKALTSGHTITVFSSYKLSDLGLDMSLETVDGLMIAVD